MAFAVDSAMSIFRNEQMDTSFRQIRLRFRMLERWLCIQKYEFKSLKRAVFKLKNKPMSVVGMHVAANALCQKFWIG